MAGGQALFDIIAGLAAAFGGWILKLIVNDIRDLKQKQDKMPDVYARRDDVKDMKEELVNYLQRIEDKMDKKYG